MPTSPACISVCARVHLRFSIRSLCTRPTHTSFCMPHCSRLLNGACVLTYHFSLSLASMEASWAAMCRPDDKLDTLFSQLWDGGVLSGHQRQRSVQTGEGIPTVQHSALQLRRRAREGEAVSLSLFKPAAYVRLNKKIRKKTQLQ